MCATCCKPCHNAQACISLPAQRIHSSEESLSACCHFFPCMLVFLGDSSSLSQIEMKSLPPTRPNVHLIAKDHSFMPAFSGVNSRRPKPLRRKMPSRGPSSTKTTLKGIHWQHIFHLWLNLLTVIAVDTTNITEPYDGTNLSFKLQNGNSLALFRCFPWQLLLQAYPPVLDTLFPKRIKQTIQN